MKFREELREESKYLLPVGQGQSWWRRFQATPYHFYREYPPAVLKSLYRDTPDLHFYRLGEAGVVPRLILRLREHSLSGRFLEYKLRLHQAHVKFRRRIDDSGQDPWEIPVEFLWKFDVLPVFHRPLLLAENLLYTACKREYLISDQGLRLTLDTDIRIYRAGQIPGSGVPLECEILELKRAWPLQDRGDFVLPDGLPPATGVSKFRLGVERLGLAYFL